MVHEDRPALRSCRLLRFLIAGSVNTVFGFALYSAMIFAGAPVWAALLLGMALGTVFSYLTMGNYVFRQLSIDRFARFVLFYLIVYFANLGALELLLVWLHDEILVQAFLVLPMAALSYVIMRNLVFSSSPHR